MKENLLICPVCGGDLHKEEKSFFCDAARPHCFDISSSGHVNLCHGRATGGDSKDAVRSRTDFLSLDLYKPIADKLCERVVYFSPKSVIDAGCGEGYYTNAIAAALPDAEIYGFDLSKEAIISASKQARRRGNKNALFCVGGIYDLPIKNASADVITNIFAPCAEEEFSRILRRGGVLLVVSAGSDHLMGLKRAVYESVYENEPRADLPKRMELIDKIELKYDIELSDKKSITDLFSMTPYSYRTSEKDYKKLLSLERLKTEVNVEISLYRKDDI